MRTFIITLCLSLGLVLPLQCIAGGTGVLLASHGSRSPQWRGMLKDLELAVRDTLMTLPGIVDVQTAFMEYAEPSIATGMKSFDAQGCHDIILVPLLLTVSSHTFDDIPTIYGAKSDAVSLERMRTEGIEVYKPRARVTMTHMLDYPGLLEQNLVKRTRCLSTDPANEAVVIVAYGSERYEEEWNDVFTSLADRVSEQTSMSPVSYSWCGHIVRYQQEPTVDALTAALAQRERVIVLPALVARDAYFQKNIIGGAVERLNMGDRIVYMGDSILPDPVLNQWVIDTVIAASRGLKAAAKNSSGVES